MKKYVDLIAKRIYQVKYLEESISEITSKEFSSFDWSDATKTDFKYLKEFHNQNHIIISPSKSLIANAPKKVKVLIKLREKIAKEIEIICGLYESKSIPKEKFIGDSLYQFSLDPFNEWIGEDMCKDNMLMAISDGKEYIYNIYNSMYRLMTKN